MNEQGLRRLRTILQGKSHSEASEALRNLAWLIPFEITGNHTCEVVVKPGKAYKQEGERLTPESPIKQLHFA